MILRNSHSRITDASDAVGIDIRIDRNYSRRSVNGTIRVAQLPIALTWRSGRSFAAFDVVGEVTDVGDIVEKQPGRASLFNHHVVPAVQVIGAALRTRVLTPRTQAARRELLRRRRWLRRNGTRELVRIARINRKSRILPAKNNFLMVQRVVRALPDLRTGIQLLNVVVIPQRI